MFKQNRVVSDYIANLGDVSAYGCAPMSVADLLDEFEVFPISDDGFDGLVNI